MFIYRNLILTDNLPIAGTTNKIKYSEVIVDSISNK